MKEVKVYIKDKNTLLLLENANEGDYINLSSLNKVDLSNIEEEILKGKDSVYEKRILDLKSQIEREYELKLIYVSVFKVYRYFSDELDLA